MRWTSSSAQSHPSHLVQRCVLMVPMVYPVLFGGPIVWDHERRCLGRVKKRSDRPSECSWSRTAGFPVLWGRKNIFWRDRGPDPRVRLRVRWARQVNRPSFNGDGLAPGFAPHSAMLPWYTEEFSYPHVVVRCGRWWCDGRWLAPYFKQIHTTPTSTRALLAASVR